MKNIPVHLQTVIASELTTLATCWKATRTDGQVFGFTDYIEDIEISGVTYEAAAGYTPTQIQLASVMNVDNLEIQGLLESPSITEGDLSAGLWDYAIIEIFQVDYTDPAGGAIKLIKGNLGQITVHRNSFIAELRGLFQPLQNQYGQLYSPSCRANLGDTRCTVNLTPFTVSATVTSVTSNRVFEATALTQPDSYFKNGKITWTSGANDGLAMEVKESTLGAHQVTLQLGMSYAIQVGDTFDIVSGCDKVPSTCIAKFNNIINFRGEPFIPGIDQMTKGIDTSS